MSYTNNDPFAPWNTSDKDNPFAPWNNPFGHDSTGHYGKYDRNNW